MTLHSAKGLEFNLVFLVGMEEGLFPSAQSVDDMARLEEERRLCYVGITRARQQLYMTYAESRRLYGRETYPRPSRFLRDIPEELLQDIRMQASVSYPVTATKPAYNSGEFNKPRPAYPPPSSSKPAAPRTSVTTSRYKTGQKVSHAKFGVGIVIASAGDHVFPDFQQTSLNFYMENSHDTA
jgi:DNA helicase-2/ATP-dependent DNA helicase PcrA